MTDRVKALTVILDDDYRDDDVQVVVQAIEMIKCVQSVELRKVTSDDFLARSRCGFELEKVLYDALKKWRTAR